VLRATKIAEETGVPGVAIVATGFMKQAAATARAMGVPDISIAEYPGNIPLDSSEVLADKVWNAVVPAVVEKLTSDAGRSADEAAEPGPRDIVFSGTLDEVQDYFDQREWSDGLPVVPPTKARVEEFLKWTDRDPGEVLGVLEPEFREATVWSVAVNGVMSGCRPEYMPILLAAVECISDPGFRILDAGATPGWEPVVVVSGDIVDALKYNTEVANMRVGRRANSSIGRFLRMYMRNVAGFRPGTTDKGSIGFTFNVSMGENEGAVKELGWDPLRVDLGFSRDDNIVMVQSVLAISAPVYSGGTEPETLAKPLVRYMAGAAGPWNFTALVFSHWHPLIQMSPAVAKGFKDLGWGKKEIRNYLFEHTRIRASWLEHYPLSVAGQEIAIKDLVDRGAAPKRYIESSDPHRQIQMLLKPEWTNIVVAGDPGRNQSRIYINNHEQGAPIARKVRLPTDWRKRLGQ
jgi:hypothetical protein